MEQSGVSNITPVSDLNMTISIGSLVAEDDSIIVDNSIDLNELLDNTDLSIYFDLLDGELNNDLLNQSARSTITLKLNSNYEILFNAPDILYDESMNTAKRLQKFMSTLHGRPIRVYTTFFNRMTQDYISKTVYSGIIESVPDEISAESGTIIKLSCITILGQLGLLSSNASKSEATEQYNNVFSSVSGNTLSFSDLMKGIVIGTYLEGGNLLLNTRIDAKSINNIYVFNGNATPLPKTLWAVLLPDNSRLNSLKEIFAAYQRLIYQDETGNVIIRPLFIDNYASNEFLVNYEISYLSSQQNWMSVSSINNATNIQNRVDVLFGVTIPVPAYGLVPQDSSIFCSAPYIIGNQIVANPDIQATNYGLDYITVYKTSARLYNSGKYVMPLAKSIQMDNSVFLDSTLMNTIYSGLNTSQMSYSIITHSYKTAFDIVPKVYAQMYLAQLNVSNYNATVVYDYLKIVAEDSPLGAIITINGVSNLDYPQMLVVNTKLRFDAESGCTYAVQTVPLLSITGIWYHIRGVQVTASNKE